MKTCLKCNLNIAGEFNYCPLCQNELAGESSENYFNTPGKLKKTSMLYKIQLLVLLAVMAAGLILDLGFKLYIGFHWSIIVVVFVIMFEVITKRLMLANAGFITYFTYITYGVILVGLVAAYLSKNFNLTIGYIIPGVLSGLLLTQFGLLLADKKSNVMAYSLGSIMINIIILLIIMFTTKFTIVWTINASTLALVFVGAIIFKGSTMFSEIQKRLHV